MTKNILTKSKATVPNMKVNKDPDTGAIHASTSSDKEAMQNLLGTNSTDFVNEIVRQTIGILNVGSFTNKEINVNSILAVINGLGCEDEVEAIIGTHISWLNVLILDCIRRGYSTDNTFEGRDANINRACKLLRAFSSQMDTLNKYRNRGNQKMTVEHVNINEGGQAVFGSISSKREGASEK